MKQDKGTHYDVIVIGGGITGAGTARDCSMRGLKTLLLERFDFTAGATGRNHGLLHSGARYAVTDQESATECIKENMILRKIASHCVEETDGLFITLPEDDLAFQSTFVASCQKAGIAPTMMALSAALGYCRKSLWQYINNNPETPSGRYLSILQTTFAAILAQLGLTRNTSEAVSIFLLKNSNQGLVDRAEVDISAKAESPLGEKADPEALRRKYLEDAYGLYADDEES